MSRTLTAALAATVLMLGMLPAAAARSTHQPTVVTTDNETPVLYDDDAGGNASGDDPAIWVHPGDSSRSIVIVTAKEGGLRVYDLESTEFQSLAAEPAPRADGVPGALQQRRHRVRHVGRPQDGRRGRGLGSLQRPAAVLHDQPGRRRCRDTAPRGDRA